MVTDPVQSVQRQAHDTSFTLDLRGALNQLALLPPSPDVPYLTVCLDWRPQGEAPGMRPGLRQFTDAAEDLLTAHQAHSAAHESLSADIARINEELDGVNPATRGLFIVACSARGVYHQLALGMPVDTALVTRPIPALMPLAKLASAYPTYGLLRVDQQHASLIVISQAVPEQSVELESTDRPRKQAQGGWSQRRFQVRADERVAAFARRIADESRRTIAEVGLDLLVLAGDELMTTAVHEELHQTVKDCLVGVIRVEDHASNHDAIAEAWPVIARARHERERDAVQRLGEALGAAGGAAVAGPEAVLTALQAGQVMTLLMRDDFRGEGWADYSLPVYGVGAPPAEHPLGGAARQLRPTALEDELVRLAVQTDAAIAIVSTNQRDARLVETVAPNKIEDAAAAETRPPAASTLQRHGGVAAILRFTLDENQPTAIL